MLRPRARRLRRGKNKQKGYIVSLLQVTSEERTAGDFNVFFDLLHRFPHFGSLSSRSRKFTTRLLGPQRRRKPLVWKKIWLQVA